MHYEAALSQKLARYVKIAMQAETFALEVAYGSKLSQNHLLLDSCPHHLRHLPLRFC